MQHPLVSIIIPVYNGSNYLSEAIDSALSQTYESIEIIVVNDGSCDDGETEKIAIAYGDKIRYIKKENGGVSSALNTGIKNMQGEYFSWLSHDDLYYPKKIELQIKALVNSNNNKAIIHSDYDHVLQATGERWGANLSKRFDIKELENPIFCIAENLVHGCSLLIHKSHFDKYGVFDEKLIGVQDYDMWFRMLRFEQLLYVDDMLVTSRIHKQQVAFNNNKFSGEVNKLFVDMTDSLTGDECIKTFGSKYNFYARVARQYNRIIIRKYEKYPYKKLLAEDMPQGINDLVKAFSNKINSYSNNMCSRICVFGAGDWGYTMHEDLTIRSLKVDFFCDNNESKWGKTFKGTICISPKELVKYAEDVLVIVATSMSADDIAKHLKFIGLKHVITKQELERLILATPPLKPLVKTCLDHFKYHEANQNIVEKYKFYEGE